MYVPAAKAFRQRSANSGKRAVELYAWEMRLRRAWSNLGFGVMSMTQDRETMRFSVEVELGDLSPDDVQVQLYADPLDDEGVLVVMEQGEGLPDANNGYVYRCAVASSRPRGHFTPRIVPYHADALVPAEIPLVLWQR
jgi:starch phosphorylase